MYIDKKNGEYGVGTLVHIGDSQLIGEANVIVRVPDSNDEIVAVGDIGVHSLNVSMQPQSKVGAASIHSIDMMASIEALKKARGS